MKPHASAPAATSDAARQRLSDLADGRLEGPDLAQGVADWTTDAELRRTWHAYQLIGDVLRSDDLASPSSGDAAFLGALRQRLAAEPVVLAPLPTTVARRRLRQGWLRPVVAAAGFVAVAGVVVVLQQATPDAGMVPGGASQLASQGNRGVTAVSAVPQGPAQAAQRAIIVSNGQMLRDARVDAYLRAHRESFAGSPAALPGGAMRNVDADLTSR